MPNDKEASDMFWDALSGGCSSYLICACGTHWNPPDDAEEDSYNWFRYVELEGKTFVQDCDGCCQKLAKYEQWIWNNRHDIREYLRIRVDQHFKWAEQEKLLNSISGIDKPSKYI
jgi:hypothetical protein